MLYQPIIFLQHQPYRFMMRLRGKAKPRVEETRRFPSEISGTSIQQFIRSSHHLHIRVEIQAAILLHHPQPHIITQISPQLMFIAILSVFTLIYIEVSLIPFPNLIARKKFRPTPPALDSQLRQRLAAKPTIMNSFRYHNSI